MQNAKSTFPIAVHVRKTFLGADGASDKNGRVPPDQDPKNIALFFKSSTANKDPTRWRDGPPPIRDEYNGREFVRRMQDKRRPASSAIIVGVAGLTTLPESWLKILKHVKRDFRLFFSLQMGRFVCEINIAKFKAALRGKKKSSDEFHIRLVAEMTGQRLNRQKRGKLNKELGSELNRQPRRKVCVSDLLQSEASLTQASFVAHRSTTMTLMVSDSVRRVADAGYVDVHRALSSRCSDSRKYERRPARSTAGRSARSAARQFAAHTSQRMGRHVRILP